MLAAAQPGKRPRSLNVPDQDNDALHCFTIVSNARAQLESGTRLGEMREAAQALRRIDPQHALLPALELRIRETVCIRQMLARSNFMGHGAAAPSLVPEAQDGTGGGS